MTYYEFALYLWDIESENETKKLLWGKVLAEKCTVNLNRAEEVHDAMNVYYISPDGHRVKGEYHIGIEADFVNALKKHVKRFDLIRLVPEVTYRRSEEGKPVTKEYPIH